MTNLQSKIVIAKEEVRFVATFALLLWVLIVGPCA